MRKNKTKLIIGVSVAAALALFAVRQNRTFSVGECLQWTGPTTLDRRNINVYVVDTAEKGDMVGRVCYNDLRHSRHCETRVIEQQYFNYLTKCDVFRPYK